MKRRKICRSCTRAGCRRQNSVERSSWSCGYRRSTSPVVCHMLGSILTRFVPGYLPSRADRVFRSWPSINILRQLLSIRARELPARRCPLAEDCDHQCMECQRKEDPSLPCLPARTNAGRIVQHAQSCHSSTLLFFPGSLVDIAFLVALGLELSL